MGTHIYHPSCLKLGMLNQYFHVRDTENTPGRDDPLCDPLFKVRPLIYDLYKDIKLITNLRGIIV